MLVLIALAAYLSLWPVPIEPVAWQAPPAPGYTGAHAANTALAAVHPIPLNGDTGPEHIVAGPDGKLYFGVVSGRILRLGTDGAAPAVYADTGGRPLGMAFDGAGQLIVADATRGLLSVAPDGKVAVLADASTEGALRFAEAVAVARNGKIYVTDGSARFWPGQSRTAQQAATLDVLEQSATGRVLEYDPATRAMRVVAQGLSFANGLVLSADERHVLVSESGRYRVWKISVEAHRIDVASGSPLARVLLDNLPGFPDNLTRGQDGRIWAGLAGPRNDLDKMAGRPLLRRMMLRVPRALWPEPQPYGHVFAFREDGTVVADLQDPSGHAPQTTGATEFAGRLYIQSVDGASLGWMPRP